MRRWHSELACLMIEHKDAAQSAIIASSCFQIAQYGTGIVDCKNSIRNSSTQLISQKSCSGRLLTILSTSWLQEDKGSQSNGLDVEYPNARKIGYTCRFTQCSFLSHMVDSAGCIERAHYITWRFYSTHGRHSVHQQCTQLSCRRSRVHSSIVCVTTWILTHVSIYLYIYSHLSSHLLL